MVTGINAQQCAEYMKKLQWFDENPVEDFTVSSDVETKFRESLPIAKSGNLRSRLKK